MTKNREGARRAPTAKNGLQKKRTAAKVGMVGSLGLLVYSGMRRAPGMRVLHIGAGVALLGLSYWHSRLYPTENQSAKARV